MAEELNLSKLTDEELSKFAYDNYRKYISEAVAPEMIRRLKISIDKFDESSTKYSKKMFWLTLVMGIVALFQLTLFIYSLFTQA